MDLPVDFFVRPVADAPDLVAFQFPFEVTGKALSDGSNEPTVTTEDNGDMIIEGWAANFDGIDRQGENFVDGAFVQGIKSFLAGQAALCFHHKHDQVLGKVLDLKEVEGKGLYMRARVDGAIKDHPTLGAIYSQIKNGTLNALSVGGFFRRAATNLGTRITDMDFTEISITGVPVHPKTSFDVIAGKALEGFESQTDTIQTGEQPLDNFLESLSSALDNFESALSATEGKAVKPPKGSHQDHRAIATVIKLHQLAQALPDSTATDEDSNGKPYVNPKVAKLGEDVREHLKNHAKTAHELAAKLGPVPADLDRDGM